MNILCVTAHPHVPQIAGGSQSSTHELALKLMERGHAVSVLAGLYHKDILGYRIRLEMKLLGRSYIKDTRAGYPTYRRWFVWDSPELVVKDADPDVVLVTAGQPFRTAKALARTGKPLALYLRDVEFDKLGGEPKDLANDTIYLANSRFTASRYRDVFGINPIAVPPFIMVNKYAADEVDPRNITFINPHPLKGRDIAFEVARRCPDIPFVFVEAWPLDAEQRAVNEAYLRQTPNVVMKPRTSDMRSIYRMARALLIPSQWEEAWGRIASEAHCCGVPAISSARGGLIESVGSGGILIPPEAPIDDWVDAVRRLWDDDAYHMQMSESARAYARRPELREENQITQISTALETAIARHAASL